MRSPLAGLAAAVGGALALLGCQPSLPPPPAQPIVFSHRIHAGKAGIGCTSCHGFAERGPVAGIPSMQRCEGCHKFVREDPASKEITAQIGVLRAILAQGTVIEWARVHRLPDHVYFTHERHVAAGIRCQECHGEVEQMEVMHQVSPLTMGWCIACHKRKIAEHPAGRAHLLDCWNCHK